MSYPHSRIYWSVMDDPKFDGVREDVRHFGSWALMLVVADMAWPAPAFLPPVPRSSIALLADRGLIDLLEGGRYRVHGLDRERNERSEKARASVAHRYNDRSTTVDRPKNDRSTTDLLAELSRAEKSRAEQSPASTPGDQSDDPLVLYADLVGRRPTQTVIDWINRLSTSHGDPAVCSAIVAATRDGVATNKLLGAVEEALSAAKREAIRRRPKVEAERTWRDDFRDLVAAGYEEAPA